jgi:hypothetical protein
MAQHIGFETRSRCIYDSSRCDNEPIYYLLMGCLEQHLGEGALCHTHASMWVNLFNARDLACHCGLDLEEYLIFETSKLT